MPVQRSVARRLVGRVGWERLGGQGCRAVAGGIAGGGIAGAEIGMGLFGRGGPLIHLVGAVP